MLYYDQVAFWKVSVLTLYGLHSTVMFLSPDVFFIAACFSIFKARLMHLRTVLRRLKSFAICKQIVI